MVSDGILLLCTSNAADLLYGSHQFFFSNARTSKAGICGINTNILLRVCSCVTNNNRFWTGWLDLLTSVHSLLIWVNYNNSQSIFSRTLLPWLSMTLSNLVLVLSDLIKLKLKLCYDRGSVDQSVLASSTHLGLKTRFLFLSVAGLLMWGAL
jgi:hypothetical protein